MHVILDEVERTSAAAQRVFDVLEERPDVPETGTCKLPLGAVPGGAGRVPLGYPNAGG
jgi:hypothetical protein